MQKHWEAPANGRTKTPQGYYLGYSCEADLGFGAFELRDQRI